MEVKEKFIIDWDHIYILGWYGPDGRPHLTTWLESEYTRRRHVTVVVTGPDVQEWGPPIWSAPTNCKANPYGYPVHHYTEYMLHEVDPYEDINRKARELGGVKAIAWCFKAPFERNWKEG